MLTSRPWTSTIISQSDAWAGLPAQRTSCSAKRFPLFQDNHCPPHRLSNELVKTALRPKPAWQAATIGSPSLFEIRVRLSPPLEPVKTNPSSGGSGSEIPFKISSIENVICGINVCSRISVRLITCASFTKIFGSCWGSFTS